jgi:hypothetical protein
MRGRESCLRDDYLSIPLRRHPGWNSRAKAASEFWEDWLSASKSESFFD